MRELVELAFGLTLILCRPQTTGMVLAMPHQKRERKPGSHVLAEGLRLALGRKVELTV
jgi:hypothetical protein